ncbi:hypothetical protein GJ496_003457 [Pomphorhynchus laevis]|nr:hypothetical protein GJ496_003457 [Pomphorhynchus laevis]
MNLTATSLETQLDNEFPSLLRPQNVFCSLYDVNDDIIGKGRYAVVKLCTNRTNSLSYAGKFIKKRRRNEILKELRVLQWSHLNPFIISLYEVHEFNSDIVFLLEHARGGDLQSLLEVKVNVNESECKQIIIGLLNGLSFLHSLQIIHLDIKPQNILLLNPWPDITVRLCDFGLSRSFDDGMPQEIAGTADYIPPEVISFDELSVACDIWSMGVVTYVLLSGMCPFQGESNQEVFVSITKGHYDFPDEYFSHVTDLSKQFIESALKHRPKLRPTSTEALQHQWLISAVNADGKQAESIVKDNVEAEQPIVEDQKQT